MIELYLSKNRNETSPSFGKYYPRVSYKQTLNIHEMAVHMAEHNTPFSEGTIEGILRDFVKCVREQTLNGNTVKVDDLAIFKVSVVGNGCAKLDEADADKTISASIGTMKKTDKTGPAVQSLKLLAQATGEYTRDELNKDGRLSWTDKAEEMIAQAKGANGTSGSGSTDSGNNGSTGNSGSGSSNQTLASPTISGNTSFTDSTQVSLSGPDGAAIHYTTDGTVPTAESPVYDEAFTLTNTTTVKAIAIKDGQSSEVVSRVFTKSSNDDGMGQD